MAEVPNSTALGIVELTKRHDPNGNLSTIAEVLAEDNVILQDAINLEANDIFGHKITRRSNDPSGSWRLLNQGVATEASKTINVTEGIGMLESFSQSDKDLVEAAASPQQFRMDEATSFLNGLSKTMATTFIYGNANTDPEQFSGLATRMSALAATTNVIGAGGTGSDLTSIYIVQWSAQRVHMIYPRGSRIGLFHEDLGIETVEDSDGNKYRAYVDHFQWKTGMAVRDDRSIARIANIESSGTSNIFDEDHLITLLNRMPMEGAGASIYCNSTVKTQMHIALKEKTNVNYTADAGNGLSGVPIMRFLGRPIRMVDKIVNTEAALV